MSFFFILICISLAYISLFSQEAYPFSSYPMFSQTYQLQSIKIIRIAIEAKNGELIWWESKFYRYPQIIGNNIKKLTQLKNELNPKIYNLKLNKTLLYALNLFHNEYVTLNNYHSFHIIERSIDKNLKIIDKTISIISFEQIKNGYF